MHGMALMLLSNCLVSLGCELDDLAPTKSEGRESTVSLS